MYLDIKKVSKFEDIKTNNFTEPIIVSEGCLDMPAIRRWSPEYLSQIFKDTPISIEIYKDKKQMGETKVNKYQEKPFNEVINHIIQQKKPYYYFAEIPISNYDHQIGTFLKSDIRTSLDDKRKPEEELIFMGYDSLSGCHLHINDDYILNQIIGTKTVYLYEYLDNPHLKMRSILSKNKNFIKDNFFTLDHQKLKVYKVVLYPGNSLIIPPWWFHAVKGHQFSCSITKIYYRPNTEYLKKYKYLSNLYYLDNNIKLSVNITLIILIILLVIFIILFFVKKINTKNM